MIIKNYHCLKTQKYLKVSKSSQLQGGDVQAESRCSQICRQPWPHVGLVMMMMMMMVMLISLPAQKWKLSDQSLNSRSRERNAAISKGRGGRVVPMPAHLDEVFKNIQWWLQYKIRKIIFFNSKVVAQPVWINDRLRKRTTQGGGSTAAQGKLHSRGVQRLSCSWRWSLTTTRWWQSFPLNLSFLAHRHFEKVHFKINSQSTLSLTGF